MRNLMPALPVLVLCLCSCVEHQSRRDVEVRQPPYGTRERVVQGPPPRTVYAPAPVYYEEGSVYQGRIVREPVGNSDYVQTNGGYYYYHPEMRVWVHSQRPAEWHPPAEVHVYHNWNEHPAYNGRR